MEMAEYPSPDQFYPRKVGICAPLYVRFGGKDINLRINLNGYKLWGRQAEPDMAILAGGMMSMRRISSAKLPVSIRVYGTALLNA